MANLKPTQVVTGEVRISYEHLLKPAPSQAGGEAKYSATILVPKTDVATKQRIDLAIEAAKKEAVEKKWAGLRIPNPPVPLYDGDGVRPSDGQPYGAECKGHWVMTASSLQKQEVVDVAGNPIIQPTEVYSGMYARVQVTFFGYNAAGKKGIGCGLGPVQKLRDGEPLGGKVTAQDVFGVAPVASYPSASVYQSPPIDPITGMPVGGNTAI